MSSFGKIAHENEDQDFGVEEAGHQRKRQFQEMYTKVADEIVRLFREIQPVCSGHNLSVHSGHVDVISVVADRTGYSAVEVQNVLWSLHTLGVVKTTKQGELELSEHELSKWSGNRADSAACTP
jgi:hypothetical protein